MTPLKNLWPPNVTSLTRWLSQHLHLSLRAVCSIWLSWQPPTVAAEFYCRWLPSMENQLLNKAMKQQVGVTAWQRGSVDFNTGVPRGSRVYAHTEPRCLATAGKSFRHQPSDPVWRQNRSVPTQACKCPYNHPREGSPLPLRTTELMNHSEKYLEKRFWHKGEAEESRQSSVCVVCGFPE